MPTRRPSASAGIINNGSSSSTRVHKSSDSHSHHAIFGQSHSASSLTHGAPPTPQQKIVQVLVNRLKNKLPCNSGEPLIRLESDNATQQAVDALVDLAHEALDMIGFALGELLEKLTQQQDPNGVVSIETMQSQLFLLKVLSVAMTTRWQPNLRAASRSSNRPMSDADTVRRVPGSSDSSTPISWSEPPPLEEACARYVLSVMILCIRQTVASEPPLIMPSSTFGDISFRDYIAEDINSGAVPFSHIRSTLSSSLPNELRTQPSSDPVRSSEKVVNSDVILSSNDTAYEKTPTFFTTSSQVLSQQIMKLRLRIHFLATHPDESSDSTDLMILGYSLLDRSRLLQIMNELSSLLVNMRLEGHKAIAAPLRYAIWSWIEHFPDEFNEVVKLHGKMDGASSVFDFLYNKCSGSERVLWPTLAILQCVIPERSSNLQTLGSSRANQKLAKFTEDLRRQSSYTAMYVQPADDEVPLQMLAYDVAHEIKGRIWNPNQKAFWEYCEDINVALWAEALVSVYRFLPKEDTHYIFSLCLEPERSDAVKLCAVRACLTLVQEVALFPWQDPLDDLQKVVAPRLRQLYRTAVTRRMEVDQYGSAKKGATRPKIKRIHVDPLNDRDLLVLGILSVWRNHFIFYYADMPENEFTMWTNLTMRIYDSSLDLAVKIAAASANLRTFEKTLHLDFSDPNNALIVGWTRNTLYQMLTSVATMLLQARTDVESQRLWSGIVLRLLDFIAKKTDDPSLKSFLNDPNRVPPMILAEIALLVSLPSADGNVSHTAAKGLRLIAHIESQADAPSNPTITEEDKSKRYPVYDRMGDPKVLVVGRVAHQKRVRKLLRLMPYYTILNIPDDVTIPIGRGESYQDKVAQWQNFALFLAVTAASSIQDNHDLSLLSSVIPQRILPDTMRTMQSPAPLISIFVNDLTALLIFEDVSIRDTAREALGVDLNARLHPKILKYFDEVVQAVKLEKETNDGVGNHENMLLFVDQFIAVLKLMVENSHGRIEEVLSIDISPTLLGLASFITRFDSPDIFRIKQKFCSLCDCVCGRAGNLSIRKDNDIRRDILDIILEWIVPPDPPTDYGFNIYEVNLSCLRTIVKLLDRLQLRPVDTSIAGDDSFHYVSRLFMKYSGILLNGFEFCQLDLPTSDSVSDVGSIQNRMRASQRETEVRDLVITGLSHLVSANTESGFKQCLPLAYDEDNRKRTIFAHVFARILSQGTKFDPEDRTGPSSGQNRLAELVKESDMTLVLAVCETCPPGEVDSMIAVLLNLFDSRASLMKLIKAMIDREVARTENEAGLFRSNSTCTRFLSAFARIHGYNYLRTLISPLIKCMESLPPGQGYELDPSKAGQQNVAQNRRNVEFVAQSFLEIIGSSTSALPSMFREICVHIAATVYERWPDAKFAALGAFVFLRFISPAVVAPETIDLDPPGDALRRGLTLIAKIIQNLANNIFFGKEAHMMVLNDFLRDHIAHVTRYLSELNRYTPGEDDDEEWLGTASDDTDIIVLHRFFDKHADKIGKELLSISKPSSDSDNSALNGKRAWDSLCTLLVDLGPPIDVPKASVLDRKDHREYKELMSRYADRTTDSVQEVYCETVPPSESGGLVYHVFRLSKINVEALDMDFFMYHFFKLLSSPRYEGYDIEIIVDCTNFTSVSELPLRWLKFCAEVFPSDLRMMIVRTHILNPNSLMQKFLRRVYNVCAGIGIAGELRAWSSIAELIPHIPTSVIESPPLKYPLSLEQEQSDLFTDVKLISGSLPTLNISPGLACKSAEIVLLADVSDVYNVQTGLETNEFIIRRSRQGDTIYFTSPNRETIIRTIRAAKSGLKDQQMPLAERFMRFSNVPATLLHIGMLSVDAYDDELRAAAYDLLGSVCTYLNYDKSPLVAPKAGFVPGTLNGFVIDLSTRLARFAPQLTLDFISEVVASMTTNDRNKSMQVLQRINCLRYMNPWIKNLELFANPTSPLFERSGARLRDCIRVLTDLSVNLPEMATNGVQKYIWHEAGQLNGNIIDIIFDELIRSATDGGIGTHRCEIIAHSISAMSSSSIAVRGRLFSKLRKAIIKASPRMPRIPSHNTGWPEVSTLIRIALIAGTETTHPLNNQLYVPEIVHVVTLVAGVGSTLIRKSVYGIIINLVQSLYLARLDEGSAPELLQLIEEMTTQEHVLNLFGLSRLTTTSEYTSFDVDKEKSIIYQQEKLTALLIRSMDVSSGSKGQLNVWKARWMSLATASAFQYSSMIQMRSFTALGALATSDVDDDFMYQMLMAFRTALLQPDNTSDIAALVSMLRCITKAVPGLQTDSRHIPQLFWLGVAFLQSSHMAFFEDAAALVTLTMKEMEKRGTFVGAPVAVRLLEARSPIEEPAQQFDSTLQLSCDASFSFSLAAVLFKGMRHSGLRDSAEEALRTLLRITAHFDAQLQPDVANEDLAYIDPDALGYFIALLAASTTTADYRALLQECGIQDAVIVEDDQTVMSVSEEISHVPLVSIDTLGINDPNTALLATSFIGVMLTTAQGDDAESEILYSVLADIAATYPEIIQMAYESLQDRIKDTFANSSNPTIIYHVSNIIRVAFDDGLRDGHVGVRYGALRSSSSTVNTVDDSTSVHGPGRSHLKALEDQGMQGLAKNFQFLPAQSPAAGKVLVLIANLVANIVS
ncbi:ras gtpase activator [Lentinula edodes]|uniref:Ras gtpase activator n=1 Tax=Lentinula edodes TaxID=5353 RepID=A0A1Q3EGW7_LENED|nr:ras gtpase activator [Lentinula edodes]